MSVFCYKPMKRHRSLAEVLRTQREGHGWDVYRARLKTHIPEKHLLALEQGRFGELPKARAHRLAYVKHYATVLGLDAEECATQFSRENGFEDVAAKVTAPAASSGTSVRSISVLVRNFVLSGVVALFAGYLVWQVKGIIEPPALTLVSPIDGSVVQERTIFVEGHAAEGTTLTINGQGVAANAQGAFSIPVDLVPGLNTLTINAAKKHGKTTKRTINVILKGAVLSSIP